MQYATTQDLIDRFSERELIQLTDPDAQAAVQTARVELVLGDAQAYADSYVGQVYKLPLKGCAKPVGASVEYVAPPQLTRIVCDVARYYLYDDLSPEHEVYLRYKAAERELQAIAQGAATLACPWGGAAGQPAGDGPVTGEVISSFSPRSITDDTLRGYA
ncbi:MAG: DUF1320 domain-containing protein [Ramlibacter sp.]|nr:DUF1320 domain-containing protein [Ramlibacter sp.]MCW5650542.1 DUF1320 domain-containing protein [Ramlibacter sp.]